MGDERNEAAVPREHGRRREREPRILHSAEGKARRQDEDVVAIPPVRPVQSLGRLHHPLGVRELVRAAGEERGLRVDAGPRAERRELQVAGRDGEQVCRDPLRHREPVRPAALRRRVPRRAHHGDELGRRPDRRAVGDADLRRVLDRDPAARVDRLRLREEEGVLLARGLGRGEPLQAGGARSGRVADTHAVGARGKRDRQGRAENGVGGADLEARGRRTSPRSRPRPRTTSSPRVSRTRRRRRRIDALDRQRRRALEDPPVEAHVEIEIGVTDTDAGRVGVGVNVAGGGHGPQRVAKKKRRAASTARRCTRP